MRRTLTVLVASAALLVPATAASAAPSGGFSNASCNAANGGNYDRTGHGVKDQDRTSDKCSAANGGGSDEVVTDPTSPPPA